jgi:hypothetical protein
LHSHSAAEIGKLASDPNALIIIGEMRLEPLKYRDRRFEMPHILQSCGMAQLNSNGIVVYHKRARRADARKYFSKLFKGLLSPTVKMAQADTQVDGYARVQFLSKVAANDNFSETFGQSKDGLFYRFANVRTQRYPPKNNRVTA